MKKILEKTRSKDDSDATKEVKTKYNELEEKKVAMRRIREKFHAYTRKNSTTVEDGRALSEAIQEYAVALLDASQASVLGNCLMEIAQMQKYLEDATTDLCSYSLKHLDSPLESFISREVENAQSVKKRYDKARASLDSLQKSEADAEGEQHSRTLEIADEALDQLRQVETAMDLHGLGFASRYLTALNTMFRHVAERSSHAVAVLEGHSSSHFFDEVDQFELETGRTFSTFSNVFSPPWASTHPDSKKSSSSSGAPFKEIRKKEISELLKKERLYVDTLKSLVKIYLFEFRNNRQVTKIVTLQDLEDLFCNVEEILDLHQDFTWDLQAALEPPYDTSVASLLMDFVPKLDIYLKYIANSSKSADTLARLLKDKRLITNVIKQCSEKDRLGRSLSDLLQIPLNYIKSYRVFTESALQNTPTSSPDYDPLDDALSLIIHLDEKVAIANLAASQYRIHLVLILINMNQLFSSSESLLSMSRRIEGGEDIVASNPARRLLRESSASTLESSVTLLLFSDLLLVCIEVENGGYVVRRRLALGNVVNVAVVGGSTVQIEVTQEPPLAFSLPSYLEAQKWVEEVKNALQNLFTTKVFGVPLNELMTKHEREKGNDIPSFITEALDTIDATGIEMEGIFRVSGSVLAIRGIKDAINQGIPVDYRALDIHSVAGMVQTWIRELPEPLLTYALYNEWVGHTAKGLEVGPLRVTVAKLPQTHRFVVQHLFQFLNRVASFGKVNKMRSGNLAIVFGPSLLYERNTTPSTEQSHDGASNQMQFLSFASGHLRDVYQVVQFLIENHKAVFEGVEEERDKFREKIKQEKVVKQQAFVDSRAEERKAIKARRMNDERIKAEVAAASDPALVKKAEEMRKAKREERERLMQEEKERQERERKRLEDELKAQQEEVKRQRAEAEEQKRLARRQQEVDEIERQYAEDQAKRLQEEERAREQRKQKAAEEKARQEEEFKAREARAREARAQEVREREAREAKEKAEQAQLALEREAREREEQRKREEALPSCSVCAKKVRDGVVSKEKGLAWHKECFTCSECRSPISGGYALAGNALLCGGCSQKKKTTGAAGGAGDGCGVCGSALSGRVVKLGDKRIHKACFVCDKCKGSLDDGYFEVKGKILCDNCAK